jgi:hypothetical protein
MTSGNFAGTFIGQSFAGTFVGQRVHPTDAGPQYRPGQRVWQPGSATWVGAAIALVAQHEEAARTRRLILSRAQPRHSFGATSSAACSVLRRSRATTSFSIRAAGVLRFDYAPTANIVVAGVTVVWGSLFAREVIAGGILALKHAGAAPTCTPPVTAPPTIQRSPAEVPVTEVMVSREMLDQLVPS